MHGVHICCRWLKSTICKCVKYDYMLLETKRKSPTSFGEWTCSYRNVFHVQHGRNKGEIAFGTHCLALNNFFGEKSWKKDEGQRYGYQSSVVCTWALQLICLSAIQEQTRKKWKDLHEFLLSPISYSLPPLKTLVACNSIPLNVTQNRKNEDIKTMHTKQLHSQAHTKNAIL